MTGWPPRTHGDDRHDGDSNPPRMARNAGRGGSGSSDEDSRSFVARCSVVKDRCARNDGSRRLETRLLGTKKAPRSRGPVSERPLAAVQGSSLRDCSSRKPSQERPRSIASPRAQVEPRALQPPPAPGAFSALQQALQSRQLPLDVPTDHDPTDRAQGDRDLPLDLIALREAGALRRPLEPV